MLMMMPRYDAAAADIFMMLPLQYAMAASAADACR